MIRSTAPISNKKPPHMQTPAPPNQKLRMPPPAPTSSTTLFTQNCVSTVSVTPAQKEDIPGILGVLKYNQSKFTHGDEASRAKSGFLIFGFEKQDLERWISNKDFKVFVAKNKEGEIIGYTLGFNMTKNKEKLKSLQLPENSTQKIFYHRHIAVGKTDEKKVGSNLFNHLLKTIHGEKFETIICEICLEPKNEISETFHLHHGFVKLGQYTEDKITLGIYQRPVLMAKL